MTRLRAVAAFTAWLLVVAGASTLVWLVISRAGEEVVSSEPLVASSADVRTTPDRTASPGDPEVKRTWQGFGGQVVAACDGGSIRLVSAQPIDGYVAEVKDDGPEELDIEFEGRYDESGTSSDVAARCVAGVPEFTAEIDEEGD